MKGQTSPLKNIILNVPDLMQSASQGPAPGKAVQTKVLLKRVPQKDNLIHPRFVQRPDLPREVRPVHDQRFVPHLHGPVIPAAQDPAEAAAVHLHHPEAAEAAVAAVVAMVEKDHDKQGN